MSAERKRTRIDCAHAQLGDKYDNSLHYGSAWRWRGTMGLCSTLAVSPGPGSTLPALWHCSKRTDFFSWIWSMKPFYSHLHGHIRRLFLPFQKEGCLVSPKKMCVESCLLAEDITKGLSLEMQGSTCRWNPVGVFGSHNSLASTATEDFPIK